MSIEDPARVRRIGPGAKALTFASICVGIAIIVSLLSSNAYRFN
jgi:hypothetical protein